MQVMQVSVWVDLNSEPKSMEASGCPEGSENKLKNLKGLAVDNGHVKYINLWCILIWSMMLCITT